MVNHVMEKFVLFLDAGGTLLEATPSVGDVYAEIAAKHGLAVSPDELNGRFRRVWDAKDREQGRLAQGGKQTPVQEKAWWKVLVGRVFEGLGPFQDFDGFFEDLFVSFGRESRWKLFPETMEVLEHLHGHGHPMAVVSNWDSRLHQILEDHGIRRFFKAVVISAEVGVSKPDPGIFRIALDRMGVRPDQVRHIGDHLQDDVEGAVHVGITPIWIDRQGGTAPKGIWRSANLRGVLNHV